VDASQIADVLAHSPVFAPLGQRERLELAARMRSRHFQRNKVIFHRDDPGGHVYLIASGTVKVSVLANRDFMDVLRGSPDAMRQLLALLATRIRRSTGHIEDLVFLDLPGRVAKLLLARHP
jgi:CRP-like cAMP-binding protein